MRFALLAVAGALLSTGLSAQSTRSVLLPPNAIDRATAATDSRDADARRAAEQDRLNASVAQRDADAKTGPLQQSTMTDSAAGFGTPQEIGAPVTPAPTPPRS